MFAIILPHHHFFYSNVGVKQGDPTSSLIFLFFINDIMACFNENINDVFHINDLRIFLLMFADESVLFSQSPHGLQSLLNDLSDYCNRWRIKINTAGECFHS